MPSEQAWDAARSKRLTFSTLVERLGPEESPASYIVQRGGKDAIRALLAQCSDDEIAQLIFDLDFWARRQQIPPTTLWETCLVLAGRGFGKTWMGSRWAIAKAREGRTLGALIGPTAADYRDTMIRGPSGILAISPPWFMPVFEPSKRRLTWPNGVYATCFSADKPDRLRGPNTGWVWGDEPASWKHEMAGLDQIPLFNRIGSKLRPPQTLLTGTPKPFAKLQTLIEKAGTVVITGSSLANAANLAPTTVANMKALASTRFGQQEVLGKLLLDVPGAIFGRAKWVELEAPENFAAYAKQRYYRRIVAVDPSPTSENGADESGIVVEGVRESEILAVDGIPMKIVGVLADRSMRGSPREWANAAIDAYFEFECDALVVEVNTGGEMVKELIETVARERGVWVNVKPVRAREQKSKRAEPVSAIAETGRIEFIGDMPKLRKQLTTFTGINGRRDDRADAMCWGVHDLVFADQFFAI